MTSIVEKQLNNKTVNYIDLCCGIGGFRIAINKLFVPGKKFECVLSADVKRDAVETYNINFNEENEITDIYNLNIEEIKPFDLLCAGFPCQPFSSAGQKKGFDDERGGMIFKIIDICKHHKPKNIILENVYNLMTLKKGEYIKRIKELFEGLGYFVNYGKLNSSNFGCPQSRERVYIVCSLEKHINFDDIKTKPKVTLNEILEYSQETTDIEKNFCDKLLEIHKKSSIYGCKIGDKRGGNKNIHSWDIGYNGIISNKESQLMNKIMLERRKKHWAKKKNIVWMDGMPLTYTEIKTFYDDNNLKNMLDNLVSKNYLRLEKPKDLIEGKRVYKEDAAVGYNICKGKLSFPISKILDPNDIAPTLTATDSNRLAVIINEKVIRKLTRNELKKICGFPDTFVVPEHVNYYNLFGNMATPPVIEAILNLIFN